LVIRCTRSLVLPLDADLYNIQLPEGSTVSDMLRELEVTLRIREQRVFSVPPRR
jgi:hypothetical protein